MWAGADPRSIGPSLDEDTELDESEHLSALTAATYYQERRDFEAAETRRKERRP